MRLSFVVTISFSTVPGASRQLQTKEVCDVTENVEAVVKWHRKDRREYCAKPRWWWWFDGSQPPQWWWKLDGRNNTTTNMCFTVSGIPQDWKVGESSPLNKYEWVRREWPIRSLLSRTEATQWRTDQLLQMTQDGKWQQMWQKAEIP